MPAKNIAVKRSNAAEMSSTLRRTSRDLAEFVSTRNAWTVGWNSCAPASFATGMYGDQLNVQRESTWMNDKGEKAD